MIISELHKSLFDKYQHYYQKGFEYRYLPVDNVKNQIKQQASSDIIIVDLLGYSVETRKIFKLKAGKGDTKILLWSQMHGDESTATRALFDVFNFLNAKGDGFDSVRDDILSHLTLYFVPMLNPDGAQRWQRRTAQNIDMNRDALRNVTIEGQLLQNLFKEIQPDYAFNLHDQASYYTAGNTSNPATISLLAPPVDDNDSIPDNRYRAMQVVCFFNQILQQYIPNCVGKWKDDYEPRAFGEHFQRQGAATILIESGGCIDDLERNLARKLNFIMLVTAFHAIANRNILKQDITSYKQIPINIKEGIFDIIYKNVTIEQNGKQYVCDIGLRRSEKLNEQLQLTSSFIIEDIGDLSPFGAFNSIDAKGKQIINQDIKIGSVANFM